MKFSIIVPVYNVREYLADCVNSLLEQDVQDYEILLIDDGSTDGSGVLCDGYQAAFPEKVRTIHQENGGLGAARNTGLEQARGEYLLFVDSDDYLDPHALACLSRAVEETDADMVCFGFSYLYGTELVPGESSPLAGAKPFRLKVRPELLLQTPSACLRIWRRSLFGDPEVRFPGRVWYEDLRTVPKALISCRKILVLPDRLYVYRQREGSIMHNPNLRRNLEIVDAMEDLRLFFEARGLMELYGPWLRVLAVENMILASQRVLMAEPAAEYLPAFIRYLEECFPGYDREPLLDRLGKKKKLVLTLLQRRQYRLLRGIFTLRRWMRGGRTG